MWKDFKAFALKGNVLDLAIGLIIGAAFGGIVSSLVKDVLMPLLGMIGGGLDFSTLTLTYKDSVVSYGLFLQALVDFIIITFSIFCFIRILQRFKRKEQEAPKAAEPVPSKEALLLTEIRDLLKQQAETEANRRLRDSL